MSTEEDHIQSLQARQQEANMLAQKLEEEIELCELRHALSESRREYNEILADHHRLENENTVFREALESGTRMRRDLERERDTFLEWIGSPP